MAQRLAGKTALVTGGGTGIGWGIALALAEEGVRVAIAGRRLNVVQAAAASWKGQPAMLAHDCDVADRASVNRLFAWAHKELGQIDILVNAAGVNIKTRSMTEMTPEQWDEVMNINSTGVYNCLHAALPPMRDRKDGLIINVSSISGKRAAPLGGIAYNASKFAVAALGTGVGNEVKADNIRITTIFPGEVDTPILEHRPQAVSAERRAKMLLPEDFGPIVVALAMLPPRAHVPELIIKPTVADYI
ncbi:SDR family oxidoreductase [Anatilimnocola sp. NA78]|uniref:SDR family oxidoreductase n=1 Tax=Anatilimnocola sp. NA78 TaxID=3415683 RepID=UPI003CE554CB